MVEVESHLLAEVDRLVTAVVAISRRMCLGVEQIVQCFQGDLGAQAVWIRLDVLAHSHVVDIAWKLVRCTGMSLAVSNQLVVYDENRVHKILVVVLSMSLENYFGAVNEKKIGEENLFVATLKSVFLMHKPQFLRSW